MNVTAPIIIALIFLVLACIAIFVNLWLAIGLYIVGFVVTIFGVEKSHKNQKDIIDKYVD